MLVRCCIIIVFYVTTVKLESPSVIIVGAGASGIAATTKLLANGITNITVLEAENRIGGRIYSVKIGDKYGDLGAEFCHGQKNNIVYELVQNLDLLDSRRNMSNEEIYYSSGSKLDLEVVELIRGFLEDMSDVSNSTAKSLGDLLIHRYNSDLLKKFENDENKRKLLKEGIRFVEGSTMILDGTYSWFDESAQSNYQYCEGEQNLIWKGTGYKIILDILTKSYPDPSNKLPIDDKIQLNTEVSKILWDQGKNPTVSTSDNRSFSADYVIFTPSIGVLKQQKDVLFEPILPTTKQNAIEAIGIAGVMKIFVYFPEKWWVNDNTVFSFYWSEKDLRSTDLPFTKNSVSWVTQIRALEPEPYLTNVWVAWVGGDLIPEIEQLSPDAIKNGCAFVLDKFLGKDYNVTEIGYVIPTKWVTNKHFLGTYSFLKAGKYKEGVSYQKIVSEPLKNEDGKPVVLFAGEATHPHHYSTVHGAIETGFREAERIITLSKDCAEGGSEHNSPYWEQPFSQPYFDNTTRREVTTTVGQTAHLHCRVRNLGDRAVSWIRKRDLHILTVGILTYTNDQRFQSLHTDGSDEWTLKVTSPQTRDSGIYECQVSTEPKISQAFKLNVVVSKAKIVGNPELYIKSGSDINLTCVVLQTPDPPSFIYWYRGGNVINYSQRGGISVVTEKQTRTSRLLISRALPQDSGNYTCSPSSSDAASVLVHVLNGEQPAAMQHGNNSSTAICWTIDFVLVIFLQCFVLER